MATFRPLILAASTPITGPWCETHPNLIGCGGKAGIEITSTDITLQPSAVVLIEGTDRRTSQRYLLARVEKPEPTPAPEPSSYSDRGVILMMPYMRCVVLSIGPHTRVSAFVQRPY